MRIMILLGDGALITSIYIHVRADKVLIPAFPGIRALSAIVKWFTKAKIDHLEGPKSEAFMVPMGMLQ